MKSKTILLITIIAFIAVSTFVLSSNKKKKTVLTSAAPPISSEINREVVPSLMDSPDGSMSLVLGDKLIVSSKADSQRVYELKKEMISSNKLEIPYNTWSPDNVYVFLKEKTSDIDDYLVLKSSGDLFSSDQTHISIQDLFQKNLPNYVIEDVTGWAAPNLLVVNTKAKDSDQKISFWFDVPSQSFIQLSTYFK